MNTWKAKFNKYLSTQFDIGNATILFMLNGSFFATPYPYTPFDHHHDKHEFFLVKKGKCKMNIEGEDYHLCADSFIIIPMETNHHIAGISEDARIFPVRIQFYKNDGQTDEDENGVDIWDILNTIICRDGAAHIFYNCGEISNEIGSVLKTIQDEQQFLYQECCVMAIKTFLIKVIKHMLDLYKVLKIIDTPDNLPKISSDDSIDGIISNKSKQVYIDIIDGYFSTFYKSEISLRELAELLKLSGRHTRRILQRVYGMKFDELSAQTRIKMAARLFSETSLSSKEIASQVGYSTYSVFFRAFRDITGMSPTEYRKMNKKI